MTQTQMVKAIAAGCEVPNKTAKAFLECVGKMAVTDITTFKVVATPTIGDGPDAAGFDPDLGLAFASNGQSATLSIVKLVNGKYETVWYFQELVQVFQRSKVGPIAAELAAAVKEMEALVRR